MRRHCLRISEAHHKPNTIIETPAHNARRSYYGIYYGSSIVEVVISLM